MTARTKWTPPVDAAEREAAIAERAQNVAVDAGAGTGKTTTCVDRLVQQVAPSDGAKPIPIEQIAAITFTRRAAGELRLKIREALLAALTEDGLSDARRQHLRAALQGLDVAHVSTIHGFADRLLRLRPVEARLSPAYEIEENEHALVHETFVLLTHAAEQGTLRAELEGTSAVEYADEARATVLDAIRGGLRPESQEWEFAARYGLDKLVEGLIQQRDAPLEEPPVPELDLEAVRGFMREFVDRAAAAPGNTQLARWFRRWSKRVETLLGEDDPVALIGDMAASFVWQRRKSIQKGRDCKGDDELWLLWKAFNAGGTHYKSQLRPGTERALADDIVEPLHQWLGQRLVRLAPVVHALYAKVKARHGTVDQIDLLIQLRDLLRDNKQVRADFQTKFRHIFVDEFQDTDPLQAEIVLFLCEDGAEADSWEDVELVPGKLTIVGDPKQSIYRFRRADVAMYDDVRTKVARDALEVELRANFRSRPSLIRWLNARFHDLLGVAEDDSRFDRDIGRVYHRGLEPGRERDRVPCVHVVPLELEAGGGRVHEYRGLESEMLPRYLRWLVEHSGQQIEDPQTHELRPVEYRDMAVLAMATTHLPVLFRELDRMDVPHVASGGRLFLQDHLHRQFVLGLRAIADRDDGVAMAALMRPPFFAIDLRDQLSARAEDPGDDEGVRRTEAVREHIRELRRRRFERPVGETARELLEGTGFARTVALGPNGAQRLARLHELCHLLEVRAGSEGLDYDGVTAQMRTWIDDPEMVDAPASVDANAVRVITVHSAKGLEFPVVVWWDAAAAMEGIRTAPPFQVSRDGNSWAVSLDTLEATSPPGVDLATVEQNYRNEERRRVVYVACTRARDLLVVPYAVGWRGDAIADHLMEEEPTDAVLTLAPYREHQGAAWAVGIEPRDPETPSVGAAIEDEVATKWAAALAVSGRPRFQPVGVTTVAHRRLPTSSDGEADTTFVKDRKGRYGPTFGTVVHRAIELVLRDASLDTQAAVTQAANEHGLADRSAEAVSDVKRTLTALEREGLRRAVGPNLRLEYPVAGPGDDGVLLMGSIDLVAADDGQLDIIDFKTDRPPNGPAEQELPEYVRQIKLYAAILERAGVTAGCDVRCGLLFTADGRVRWV